MAVENLILECIRRDISVTEIGEYFHVLCEISSEMQSSTFKKDEFQIAEMKRKVRGMIRKIK